MNKMATRAKNEKKKKKKKKNNIYITNPPKHFG